ncbi:MAG: pyridoxal phosphate-dependent decarboxylase family protein [Gemmataceae bacterium]
MNDDLSLHQLRRRVAKPLPHPEPDQLREAGQQVLGWLLEHFRTLPQQTIGQSASRAEMEALLREPPPEQGRPFAAVLADFEDKVARYAFRVNHPRFWAFIPGAPTFPAMLADFLCAGTNFFAGVWLEASGPAQVEVLVLDWFKEMLGYPAEAAGVLTSGGSEANLIALLAARERLTFAQRAAAILYVSEQRHWSLDRAAKIIGLRPEQVRPVPVDDELRLIPAALAAHLERDRQAGLWPWAVAASAGSTNSGGVDPLMEISYLCHQPAPPLWLHVDAAYGWPAALTDEGKRLLAGIEQADSITLDPHKWFAQTFEVGCVLTRHGPLLGETFALRPDYMQDVAPGDQEINFCDHGIALTRRFRALKIWFSMQVLGVGWFRRLVEHCRDLAELAQRLLRQSPVFEVLGPRHLSIVCFRYAPPGQSSDMEFLNRLNLALVEALRATGQAFISSTRLGERVALRFCFINWRTTARDVEEVIELLAELGAKLHHDAANGGCDADPPTA